MYPELLLLSSIGLILFGLTRSTETILDLRQRERDRGTNVKTYL